MDVSIILLNYNTRDLLGQSLTSIVSNYDHEVIVVDNNSTDGSVEMVKKQFPNVEVIESDENIGFAAGNNLGLKQAKGRYLMLLNSDTLVMPQALDRLINYMDKSPDVGMVTPKLELESGQIDGACHRGLPTLWNSFTYFAGLERLFPKNRLFGGYHLTYKNLTTIHPVGVVSGAAMLFRSELLDQVGFLDEQFFMYAEDIDYCKRVQDAGWPIIYYPRAKVLHFKGRSGTYHLDKTVRSQTRQYFYKTMKQYFRKHYSGVYPNWVLQLTDWAIEIVARVKG